VKDTHEAGVIPVWEVIQYSSNVGSLKLGLKLTQKEHFDYLRAFGFGLNTGLGLGGESGGILRSPPWREVEHATFSYGYGFSASPLQVNFATAAIANGGKLMRPMLVKELRSRQGAPRVIAPEVRTQAVTAETAQKVSLMLETVTSEAGTGTNARVPGFRVAGKTGTAKLFSNKTGQYESEYLASFTGYLPVEQPEFAITVMILRPDKSKGYYGGVVAAPLFREVAAQALVMANIFPAEHDGSGSGAGRRADEESGIGRLRATEPSRAAASAVEEESEGDPTASAATSDPAERTVPKLLGMSASQAIQQLAALQLEPRLTGRGRVVGQEPSPGEPVAAGAFVTLKLGDPLLQAPAEPAAKPTKGGVPAPAAPLTPAAPAPATPAAAVPTPPAKQAAPAKPAAPAAPKGGTNAPR
jgi:cell division protein FtsI (penicillin-binding protein 3)